MMDAYEPRFHLAAWTRRGDHDPRCGQIVADINADHGDRRVGVSDTARSLSWARHLLSLL